MGIVGAITTRALGELRHMDGPLRLPTMTTEVPIGTDRGDGNVLS